MKRNIPIFILIIILTGCMQVISSKDNQPPKAQFSVNYKSANTSTQFIFDGSFSSDDHDLSSEMKYLWKYFSRFGKLIDSSFGIVDSAFFSDTGYYFINLTVFDSDSLTDSCEDTIHVSQSNAPTLTVIDTTIYFGPVELGYSVNQKLAITNSGTDTLKISAIFFTGDNKTAFSCNFEKMINVMPDSTELISINFSPEKLGMQFCDINIVTNDRENPTKQIAIVGEGFDDLYDIIIENLVQDTLDFGNVKVGSDSSFNLVLKNIGSEPREILAAYITGENKSAFRCNFSAEINLAAGESKNLEVEFLPQDTTFQTAMLVIKSDDQFSEKKEILLTGKGYKNSPIMKLIDIEDDLLDFSGTNIEKDETQELEIKNIGQDVLNISAIFVAGDDRNYFDCDFQQEISLEPGASYKLDITFTPTQKRTYSAQLKIYSNDTNAPVFTLNLSGTGTQSLLEILSPTGSMIDFGNVKVDADSTITIKIKNTGDGDMTVEDIYLMNENGNAFRCDFQSEFLMEPGATTNFNVTFSPLKIQNYSADLVIKTDEIENNKKTIAINGIGYQAYTMLVDKDSLNFGNVYIGEESKMSINIVNNNDKDLRIFDVNLEGNYVNGFTVDFTDEISIPAQSNMQIEVTFTLTMLIRSIIMCCIFTPMIRLRRIKKFL